MLIMLAVAGVAVLLGFPSAALAITPSAGIFRVPSTGATTAEVDGVVNPEGQSTTYQVQYDLASSQWCTSGGASGSPAHTTTATPLGFTDDFPHEVTVDLSGLTADTDYCAQLIATNGDGEGDSGQKTWTQGIPVAFTDDAFSTGETTAHVDGAIIPSGQATTYDVQYDLQSSDWCTSGGASGSPAHTTTAQDLGAADTKEHFVGVDLTGLTGGTAYCATFAATNASGPSATSFQARWTQGLPDASTDDALSSGPTTATVDGSVNPVGQATKYQVQYDLESSDWCQSGGTSGSPANTTTAQDLSFTDDDYHEVSVNITGLTAGTEYCAQLIATNGSGESDGGQVTWLQGHPLAETFDAFSTGSSTATVEGDVNPAGQTTTYKVQYDLASSDWCTSLGSSGSPANTTAPATLGFTDGAFHDVSVTVTGLSSGTQYCAQLVAVNGIGEADGGVAFWIEGKPEAITDDAFSTGATTAEVDGEVNPAGQSTTYQVEYDFADSVWCTSGGTGAPPAHTTDGVALPFTDSSEHAVSVNLTGLSTGSQYCARLTAINGTGEGDGDQLTWTEGTPGADTFDAFSTGKTAATVEGEVNPAEQSTTYRVVYDAASSDWCTSGGFIGSPAHTTAPATLGFTDDSFHDVSVNVTGLTEGTSYCGELEASNGGGNADGSQVQWTEGAPSADTNDAAATGATTATVTGDVNPAGQTTTYKIAYDLASSDWCTSGGFIGLPAHTTTAATLGFTDGTFHNVSVNLTGLTPSTAYCGELTASNSDGIGEGFQVSWTQSAAPIQHTLTVSKAGSGSGGVTSSPGGINCGATCSAMFDQGTSVTLTATASAGSVFAGWSGGGCAGTGTCQVTLGADTTVTATFNPAPTVTHTLTVSPVGDGSGGVTSSPAGIDCGVTCSHAYNAGTQVTLTATADSGSTFTGWSGGACSGTGTCVVTLNSDTTVTATFAANAPPPATVKCIVPKLKGKALAAAKRSIKSHHCSVGTIKKVKSSPKNKGKVVSQSPKPGKHLRKGSKVSLKVGK